MRRIDNEGLPYPWEIRYYRSQIKWLLSRYVRDIIREGQWPFSIKDEALNTAGVSHHAAFEQISIINVEIDNRIKSVGRDGDLCLGKYYHDCSNHYLARVFNISVQDVERRIKRAMTYMAGRLKSVSYDQWIANGWHETPRRQKPIGAKR